jgi:hypothetical protein
MPRTATVIAERVIDAMQLTFCMSCHGNFILFGFGG